MHFALYDKLHLPAHPLFIDPFLLIDDGDDGNDDTLYKICIHSRTPSKAGSAGAGRTSRPLPEHFNQAGSCSLIGAETAPFHAHRDGKQPLRVHRNGTV